MKHVYGGLIYLDTGGLRSGLAVSYNYAWGVEHSMERHATQSAVRCFVENIL